VDEGSGWDDLPLLKYESEIFIKTGAWNSLEHLESSLILNELFLLYRACMNETSTSIKIAAASQGAQIDFDEDWYDDEPKAANVLSGFEIQHMPIGLGYEAISS
jgi:hypothetical protein